MEPNQIVGSDVSILDLDLELGVYIVDFKYKLFIPDWSFSSLALHCRSVNNRIHDEFGVGVHLAYHLCVSRQECRLDSHFQHPVHLLVEDNLEIDYSCILLLKSFSFLDRAKHSHHMLNFWLCSQWLKSNLPIQLLCFVLMASLSGRRVDLQL